MATEGVADSKPKGIQKFWNLLVETGKAWDRENAPRLGAAIAYYTVFSLAPLLVVAVAIAGLVFGKQAVQGELSHQMEGLIGPEGAKAVEGLVASAWEPTTGVIATVIGVLTLIIGGTAVFTELRAVLNQIWKVPVARVSGIWAAVKSRLLSFAMMGAIAFLLLVSLVANTVLAAASGHFSGLMSTEGILGQVLYNLLTFGLITGLFASVFKVLPETRIEWRDVWVGALLTAGFFSIGKFLIGLYLGRASVTSSYGASGSLVVIMLWAYYTSLIVIFGAEFSRVYSDERLGRAPDSPHERIVKR